jgi:hypothetical protein
MEGREINIFMKLSIYFYLFNATVREFDLDSTVLNFTSFADEVVCSTIPSEDDTYERLIAWQERLGVARFKVVMTDIQLSNNRFDGLLKTAALQGCSRSTEEEPRVYVIADADERFALSNRPKWIAAAERLTTTPYDGYLVPVLDLYKDENHIKSSENIGMKFRMHDDSVVKRGVIPEAEMGYNNLFRTDMSDSTEPLRGDGKLARFISVVRDPMHLWPLSTSYLNDGPYVLHYGHLDANRRAKINREFWYEHWKARSGWEPNMVKDADEIRNTPVVKHNVALT